MKRRAPRARRTIATATASFALNLGIRGPFLAQFLELVEILPVHTQRRLDRLRLGHVDARLAKEVQGIRPRAAREEVPVALVSGLGVVFLELAVEFVVPIDGQRLARCVPFVGT